MRTIPQISRLFLCSLLFTCLGCSHGFDRNGLRQTLSEGQVPKIKDSEASLSDVLALKPQLPRRARLAVSFEDDFFWSGGEEVKKKILDGVNAATRHTPFVEVFAVRDFESSGRVRTASTEGPMYEQRKMAARYSADAVLVVRGNYDDDRYANPLVIFDIATLSLSGLFLPSQQIDVLTMITASLWDVRNGYMYLTAEAEGLDRTTYPVYWGGDQKRKTVEGSRLAAVDALVTELGRRVESMEIE